MKTFPSFLLPTLLILGYVVSLTASNLLLKIAADSAGYRALGWFIAGNVAGFFCPLTITFALRHGPPHLVYAWAIAGGFCVLQLASIWMFRAPLNLWQWTGLSLVALGLFFLQWSK